MVKRAKLAAKKARKLLEGEKQVAQGAAAEEGGGGGGGGPAPPQHIQRKLTRKVKFLERVAATKLSVSKGGGGGGVAKKKKKKAASAALTDLASLSASLNEAALEASGSGAGAGGQQQRFGRSVGTQRARERVAEVETQRLQQVLQHPQFQADPLAAITSHLAATLPAAAPPPPAGKQQRKDAATLRREKKKRRKERAAAAAAMGDD